jgi:vitamin B12 transporter
VFATDGRIGRFEYTGSFSPKAQATLVYGLDLQQEQIESGEERARDQDGYYLEYQRKFDERLFLTAGARYDDNEDFGSHTSGRLGVAYVQTVGGARTLKYRASYGTGFRAPSLFEVAFNFGPFASPPAAGVGLIEETSEGYDVGAEYDTPGGLHLELTYFDQRIEDEIYFDLVSFSGYLQSPGASKSEGFELAVQAPLAERWQLLANWTHNETADTTNQQRLRRPKNLGNIGVQYDSAAQRLQLVMNYRVSRDSIDMGGVALEDYGVLDVSAAFSINRLVQLFARIQNVTDESYQEVRGYNTAGREAYAGVRLRF